MITEKNEIADKISPNQLVEIQNKILEIERNLVTLLTVFQSLKTDFSEVSAPLDVAAERKKRVLMAKKEIFAEYDFLFTELAK